MESRWEDPRSRGRERRQVPGQASLGDLHAASQHFGFSGTFSTSLFLRVPVPLLGWQGKVAGHWDSPAN